MASNQDKKVVGLSEISFYGHKISKEGEIPDNTKIQAIIEMSAPTHFSGVKSFCGIVLYIAKFMPALASHRFKNRYAL